MGRAPTRSLVAFSYRAKKNYRNKTHSDSDLARKPSTRLNEQAPAKYNGGNRYDTVFVALVNEMV